MQQKAFKCLVTHIHVLQTPLPYATITRGALQQRFLTTYLAQQLKTLHIAENGR